jgi:DME family drug/metabolite transporter
MITIGSAPIIAGIIGRIFFSEKLSGKWLIATILAVGGCCILSIPSGDLKMDITGVIFALGAGISWAVAGSSMKMFPPSRTPVEKAAVMLLLGSLIISPVLLFGDLSWALSLRGAGVVFHLSLMATALPYALFAMGIPFIPVSTAYTLTLAEPLTASCLGLFLLGEELTSTALMGIILIFSGLVILSLKGKTNVHTEETIIS